MVSQEYTILASAQLFQSLLPLSYTNVMTLAASASQNILLAIVRSHKKYQVDL